jgi:hypothetical protein
MFPDIPKPSAEQEALRQAVAAKDRESVHRLLRQGVDIEPTMRGVGFNRLVLAARFNLPDILDAEHKRGTHEPYYYHEALHFAAGDNHPDLVYKLLGYGFDATSTKDFDIAGAAMLGGHVGLLQEFIAQGYTTDLTCKTMMEGVIQENHGPMLDFILSHGADEAHARSYLEKCQILYKGDYHDVEIVLDSWAARKNTIHDATFSPKTLDDLRKPMGAGNGFLYLAKTGAFDKAIDIALQNPKDFIKPDDLSVADTRGNNTFHVLGARGQLAGLALPKLWLQRPDDFAALVKMTPPVYRKQIDDARFLSTLRQQKLRAQARGKNLRPKPL